MNGRDARERRRTQQRLMRIPSLSVGALCCCVLAASLLAQQYPKEYIYLGRRIVAVEIYGNEPPEAVSVTPSSGSGTVQTFTYRVSDPNGYGDIGTVVMLVNATLSGANGCYVWYYPATQRLYLMDDPGAVSMGPLTIGTAGTLENSQCVLDAGSSSSSGSNNDLTVNLALTFKPAFSGTKNNYLTVSDSEPLSSGWQLKGTWNVQNEPPEAVSVVPSSGSGSSQTFTYTYSDANGFADILASQLVVNASLTGLNSCYLYYYRPSNLIYLRNDQNTAWSSPLTLGTTGTLENSQCIVDAGASSSSGAANTLTVNLKLTFKVGFSGSKINYMYANDVGGLNSGWQLNGTWTVP